MELLSNILFIVSAIVVITILGIIALIFIISLIVGICCPIREYYGDFIFTKERKKNK